MVRVWIRGGFGEGLGVITYRRMPMHEPELVASVAGTDGPQSAQGVIPAALWDRVVMVAKDFDRRLIPPSAPVPPCIHAAGFLIEAVDAARPDEPPVVRRAQETACPAGLVSHLAELLIDMAPEQIPACSLAVGAGRDPLLQLGACTMLQGDRQAAAAALNLVGRLDVHDPEPLHRLLDERVRVRWLDEPQIEGAEMAWPFLSKKFALESWIIPQRWIGETADRVRVEGRFNAPDGDERFTMVWVRGGSRDFRLASMVVERGRKPERDRNGTVTTTPR
jgi:hypothetical protein